MFLVLESPARNHWIDSKNKEMKKQDTEYLEACQLQIEGMVYVLA